MSSIITASAWPDPGSATERTHQTPRHVEPPLCRLTPGAQAVQTLLWGPQWGTDRESEI